jgi:osmoprotectant transport system permease protein
VRPDEPLLDLGWVGSHVGEIAFRAAQHVGLAAIAVGVGFAIAFALATWAARHRRVLPPIIAVAGVLYTIPSLALFAALVPFTGLTLLTAEIPLVLYTQLILVRAISAGFDAAPADVLEAADALGMSRRQRFLEVELPIAVPLIVSGVRLAAVSTIGLVMVVTLIGNNFGGLGLFITEGISSFFPTKVYVGAGLSVLLAIGADLAISRLEHVLAPWSAARQAMVLTGLGGPTGGAPPSGRAMAGMAG